MGAVGGLLGTAGGASGTGFSIQSPVTTEQANTAYNGVQNSLQGQQSLLQALQAQQGIQNQSNVYNQLQAVAAGQGPNPAQAMLNQSTGQNVSNQAALMAGQRGAGQNVGLIARQAAQQGANVQQQAVGQGATLQAQQSLNALGTAGNLATTQAGQQIGQTNANTSAQQAEQSNLLNSIAGVNQVNGALANTTIKSQPGLLGGVGNALGAGVGALFSASPAAAAAPALQTAGESSGLADGLMYAASGGVVPRSMIGRHFAKMANGGNVPALVSPGEVYLTPKEVKEVRKGADPMKVGEKIKGKPSVGGAVNSYANDTVKKDLKSGGVIVPRSETMSNNPKGNSKRFVDAAIAKRKVK